MAKSPGWAEAGRLVADGLMPRGTGCGLSGAFHRLRQRYPFLCRYLHSLALRREIHEGLDVVEHWNGANSFILYGRGGELATDRVEDQEITMPCLHLLQNCMVYVNTLLVQRVLGEPVWVDRMGATERRALTPLFWGHINPYGAFRLDMAARLPIDPPTPETAAGQLLLEGI